jgi:hypothetical protein
VDSRCRELYDSMSLYTALGERGTFVLRNVSYPLRAAVGDQEGEVRFGEGRLGKL